MRTEVGGVGGIAQGRGALSEVATNLGLERAEGSVERGSLTKGVDGFVGGDLVVAVVISSNNRVEEAVHVYMGFAPIPDVYKMKAPWWSEGRHAEL